MSIGKYEREALERERRDLLGKRQYPYFLSPHEGRRLDELNSLLGDDPIEGNK